MRIPRAINNLIESFQKLPGVGPKSAQRLTFYLLHVPDGELQKLANSVLELKKDTKICSICSMIDEASPCSICEDTRRDISTICVVEEPLDVLALEKSGKYNGIYHVLHGRIDPLNNIGPDEIYMRQLFERLTNGHSSEIKEIILATNPTMEGEATAMYIVKELKNRGSNIRVTRIGRGLPIGSDLEYADEVTLQRAMEGRQNYE